MAIKARIRRNAQPSNVAAPWKSRIVGEADVPPRTLVPNDANWRKHPERQQSALGRILADVGWVQRVIVNKRTVERGWPKGSVATMLDGHARLELAIDHDEPTVPVVYVDLSQEEERLVLATLDPIGALADTDEAKLEELLGLIAVSSDHADLLGDTFDDSAKKDSTAGGVEEIDTADVHDEFWLSVRGPLAGQAEALERLKEALGAIPGVTVELGTVEGV